jgi:hypothetical protein
MPSISLIATTISLGIFVLAIWRGGGPERAGAIILFAAFVADELYHAMFGPGQFRQFDLFEFVLDVAVVLSLGWVAVRANRLWPIFATAVQIISVLGHLVMLVRPDGMQRAYWSMTEPPVLLEIIILATGLAFHRYRVRCLGRYPDWRRPLPS